MSETRHIIQETQARAQGLIVNAGRPICSLCRLDREEAWDSLQNSPHGSEDYTLALHLFSACPACKAWGRARYQANKESSHV